MPFEWWYPLVIILLAVSALTIGLLRAHRRFAIEEGKTPLHKANVGGTIGWTGYRGPLISVRVYDEFIVIGSWQRFVLPYDQIDRVELKNWFGMMPSHVQIIHHQPGAPKRIILGSSNPARLKELIEARIANS
jgi:hypothetical protein